MINDIFSFLSSALSGNPALAVFAAAGWGVLSILLSPCHLSSIPLVVGFINSQQRITAGRTFSISLVFASGILITIALIGVITAYAGRLIGDTGAWGSYLVAVVFLVVGLYFLDIIKLPWSGPGAHATGKKGLLAALTLGLIFGIGLGPCTFAFMAPVLGIVFQIGKSNLPYSVILLLAFGLGHCAVIVLAGTLSQKVQKYLNWQEGSRAVTYVKRICGILVIAGGAYLVYSA
jgi:cytochrome c-type biogenesis protein